MLSLSCISAHMQHTHTHTQGYYYYFTHTYTLIALYSLSCYFVSDWSFPFALTTPFSISYTKVLLIRNSLTNYHWIWYSGLEVNCFLYFQGAILLPFGFYHICWEIGYKYNYCSSTSHVYFFLPTFKICFSCLCNHWPVVFLFRKISANIP